MGRERLEDLMIKTLSSKTAFGQSRHEAKKAGVADESIFSHGTYKTYRREAQKFCRWLKEHDHNCRYMDQAKKYVDEYLQDLKNEGYSPWTQQTARAAINKIYGEPVSSLQLDLKRRDVITRSRFDVPNARHFSVENNAELINFCKHTGLRRMELEKLKPEDLIERDGKYFLHVIGKGGKEREAPVLQDEKTEPVIRRIQDTEPGQRVWDHVHSAADIHGYRADYAAALYRQTAREIETIEDRHEIYHARGDRAGESFDRVALFEVAEALGHNRESVSVLSYLYDAVYD